jgi:hypothetical protein
MNTPNGWAMFGLGMTAMLVLVLIAFVLLLWHWGKTIPDEFKDTDQEARHLGATPKPQPIGTHKGEPPRPTPIGTYKTKPVKSAIFVFVATDGKDAGPAWRGGNRRLIDYMGALRLLCAQYTTEDIGKQIAKLEDITDGRAGCVSVAGGMIERPLKMGECALSGSRPLPPAGRDGGSPLRNHPELAESVSYIRQCITDSLSAEDYAARAGRIPELFEFRSSADKTGRAMLITRKEAERMTGQHFPQGAAVEIVASLARGASSLIATADGRITRFEPLKA